MEENQLPAENSKAETKKEVKKTPLTPLFYIFFIFVILYGVSIFISLNIISKTKKVKIDSDAISTIKKDNKNKVALIPIYGAIYKRDSGISDKGSDLVVNMIKKYGEDKNIKAIVLDINSPGGSVGAVQEIYSMIKKIKEQYKKPVVAHFGDVAASGGFYVAMACDKIISNSGTITGSIGVIFSTTQGEELFKKIGLKSNTVKSGKFKDIGSFSREMTKEERALLQDMIDDTYGIFVDVVASGRKMDKNKVKDIADGRIFTGSQAYQLGLVDKIGDLYDAIDEAGVMAGIGKNPSVVKARVSIFEDIFQAIDSKLAIFSFASADNYPKLEYRFSF
ncbi:MAG: signal peptide peptidase SppA [Elusimicrobiales bacterium]|nr:signal peptide peptidase SppA [Elusimicrobiales bacterium]HOL62131.1 signal peptide peptidase SppA [Elusimicrobiales bacterium]HPO94718.1 signal peptide peptidase SppA [Elusimicrobiales bacterium]